MCAKIPWLQGTYFWCQTNFFLSQKMTANIAVTCNESSSVEKIAWIKKDCKNTVWHTHFAKAIANKTAFPSLRRDFILADLHSSWHLQVFTPHVAPTVVWGLWLHASVLPHKYWKYFPTLELRDMTLLCLLVD